MNSLDDVIFIESLPTIDLHGLDRDTARVLVTSFIKDNLVLKNKIICIVHGIGSGIIKNEVHNTLKKNKYVEDFKLFYNNIGSTVVKLK